MSELNIGIKFYGHDSAVFIVDDIEKDIFGIATERLTRYKHDDLFAVSGICKYLEYKNIDALKIKKVNLNIPFTTHEKQRYRVNAFNYKLSQRKFLKATYLKDFFIAWKKFKEESLKNKLKSIFFNDYGIKFLFEFIKGRNNLDTLDNITKMHLHDIFPKADITIKYYDHEFCHVASTYYMSPYNEALVFSMDGFGDDLVYSRVYLGKNGKLVEVGNSKAEKEFLNFGNFELSETARLCSLGGIYSYITKVLGFQEGADEGKTEALAAYGSYNNLLYNDLFKCAEVSNGTIVINILKAEEILNFNRIQKLLTTIKREDIAAAVQKFIEDIIFLYIKYYIDKYKVKNICLSGGVHANVIVNLNIYEKISSNIYIIPAMADDGTAQGALLANLVEKNEDISWIKEKQMPYYGTSYSKENVIDVLNKYKDKINFEDLGEQWPEKTAHYVVDGKIGSLFHGRMEFGPRALGNRSIIASPANPTIRSRMNLEIKKRPEFQPFCPSILDEEMERLFEKAYLNKHMTTAFRLKKEFYDDLPSAIHIDGTARVQFVSIEDNLSYYRLLKEIKKLTGFGVILNTSFNKHGRTIVESPEDAIIDFLDTDMEYLVIEGYLVTRKAF